MIGGHEDSNNSSESLLASGRSSDKKAHQKLKVPSGKKQDRRRVSPIVPRPPRQHSNRTTQGTSQSKICDSSSLSHLHLFARNLRHTHTHTHPHVPVAAQSLPPRRSPKRPPKRWCGRPCSETRSSAAARPPPCHRRLLLLSQAPP